MSRTFPLFLSAGAVAWLIFGLGAVVGLTWIALAGLIAVVAGPFVVAAYRWRGALASPFAAASRWRRGLSSPFSKAAAGLFMAGTLFYAAFWATTIAPFPCAPDDFGCRTVGSQWELSLMLVLIVTLASVASAAVGALVGSRLFPQVAAEPTAAGRSL